MVDKSTCKSQLEVNPGRKVHHLRPVLPSAGTLKIMITSSKVHAKQLFKNPYYFKVNSKGPQSSVLHYCMSVLIVFISVYSNSFSVLGLCVTGRGQRSAMCQRTRLLSCDAFTGRSHKNATVADCAPLLCKPH